MSRCKSCMAIKLRCSLTYPCDRCVKLCLQCKPADHKEGLSHIELAMSCRDPRTVAEAFMSALRRLTPQGGWSRPSILRHLRSWRALSVRAGADVTWGLLDAAMGALGLEEADISPTGEWSSDLGSSASFQALPAPPSPPGCTGRAMQVAMLPCPGGAALAINDAMQGALCTLEELQACLHQHHVCPLFAITSLVALEDWPDFADVCVQAIVGVTSTTHKAFVKLARRDRPVDLAYVRCRPTQVRGPGGEAAHGWVLTLEEVPPSRHVTRKPWHHHKLLAAFKRAPEVLNAALGFGGATACEATQEHHLIQMPGMCCVPLPLPPPQWTPGPCMPVAAPPAPAAGRELGGQGPSGAERACLWLNPPGRAMGVPEFGEVGPVGGQREAVQEPPPFSPMSDGCDKDWGMGHVVSIGALVEQLMMGEERRP